MIKYQDESQPKYDEQFQQSLDQNKSKDKNQEETIFVPNVNESFNIDNYSKSYQRQHIVQKESGKITVKQKQSRRKTKSNSSVDQLVKSKNTCPVILPHKNKKSDQNIGNSVNSNQNHEKDPQSLNFQPKAHQFKRTNFANQRRSLHLMIKNHNEANIKGIIKPAKPQEFIFLKNKEYQIPKHNKSFRRYLEEEPAISQNNYNSQKNIGSSDPNNNGTIRLKAPSVHEALKSLNQSKQIGSRKRTNRSFNSQQMKQDIVFKDPEHNSTRQVVFIKTYILSPFQSISIEISILHQSLIITGYLIGQEKETLKLIFNAQKSQKLISQSFGDWDLIGKRIYVEAAQNGQKSLRIAPLKNVFASIIKHEMQNIQANPLASSTQKQTKLRHQKLRYQKQQQFIRRNYYSVKLQKNNQTINTNQNSTTQNTINHNQNLKNKDINQFALQPKQQKNFNFQGHLMRLSKHLNYLSPEIRVKAQIIQEEKQKSLTKQQIKEEMLKKEELLKNQIIAVQRLSKPKKVQTTEEIREKSKEKTGPVKLNSIKNQFVKQIIVKKPTSKALIKNHFQRQNQKQKSQNPKIYQKEVTQKKGLSSYEQASQQKQSLNSSHKQLNQDEFQAELLRHQAQNYQNSYENQAQQKEKYSQFEDQRSIYDKHKEEKQQIILGRTQSKDFGEDQSQYNINSFIKSSKSTIKNSQPSKIVDRTKPKEQKIHVTESGFHSKDQIEIKQKKADKFTDDDYEQLIRDIDDEYDNSFDQFKEEPQKQNLQSKIFIQVSQKSMDSKKQHEQILQNAEDNYEEAQFQEDISSQKDKKKLTENQKIQQNDIYPSDNQQIQQNDQVYEDSYIPSEGQLILSKNKSNVIEQQEYLDEQFDN